MMCPAFAISGGGPAGAAPPRGPLARSGRTPSHLGQRPAALVGVRARRPRPRVHALLRASLGFGPGGMDLPLEIREIDLDELRRADQGQHQTGSLRPRTDVEDALFPSGNAIVPQVVAVGEILFDVLYGPGAARASNSDDDASDEVGAASSRAAESQAAERAAPARAMAGGAPANLAATLARLGAMVAMVGPVGDDPQGAELIETLRVRGVNTDGLLRVKGAPTRRVRVHIDEQGEREFVGFEGNNAEFADAQSLDLFDCPSSLFYESEFLVCGTLGLAFPGSAENMDTLVELAKSCDLCVVVDVNWRPVFWDGQVFSEKEARQTILRFVRTRADVIKITTEEVAFLFGSDLAARALAQPELVAEAVGKNIRGVLVTAGKAGAAWTFADKGAKRASGRVRAFAPPGGHVVDSTGAGDVFLGGFLAELLRNGGLKKLTCASTVASCAKFGAAVAAVSLTGMGGIDPLPLRTEVEAFLATNPRFLPDD